MRNDFCSDYLEHSAKGTSWKNVKYLKKVPLGNGKFYYIYTQAQLNAYNKRNSQNANNNVLSDKYKAEIKKQVLSSAKSLEELQREGFTVKGKTPAEKTANLKKNIKDGEDAIKKALEKEASKSKKSSSSKSSSSGSSGKSSKGSSGGSSKKSSSSKSSGAAKEKASSSSKKAAAAKTTKAATEKTTQKAEQKKAVNNTPINLDTLKKIYGAKDEDVTTHDMSASDFKNKMLSKYDEGSFGYLMAGDKAYKWTIEGGQLVIKDFDTDKDVSFDTYLKDVKQFKEFQTNKKKK